MMTPSHKQHAQQTSDGDPAGKGAHQHAQQVGEQAVQPRSHHYSLKGRMLWGISVWVVASVLVAGWTLNDLFRQHVTQQLASELEVHLNQLVAAFTVSAQGEVSLQFEPTDPRLMRPLSGLYWQIDRLGSNSSSDTGMLRSRSLWDEVLQVPRGPPAADPSDYSRMTDRAEAAEWAHSPNSKGLNALTGPDGSQLLALIRIVTPAQGQDRFRLIVATDQTVIDAPISDFTKMLSISLGLLALGMTAASGMLLTFGLRPLKQLRMSLIQVRQAQTEKLEGHYPTELQPLVTEFNQVLVANNKIVERSRTLAGNLAHALKTPLSVMANGAREEASPFAQLVQDQVALATRQVDHHLARARAAAAATAPGAQTPLLPIVQSLSHVLEKLYFNKTVVIHTDKVSDQLTFKGDRQDLQEILGNLLENACKWAGSEVWVSAVADTPATLTLRVEDDGPGLAPSQQEAIFTRGVRMDEKTPGSGLGLDIVRDLTNTYGGRVTASTSKHGGLCVSVTLPRASRRSDD